MEQRVSPDADPEERLAAEVAVTTELIGQFIRHIAAWEKLAHALSMLDVLTAFAAFGTEKHLPP